MTTVAVAGAILVVDGESATRQVLELGGYRVVEATLDDAATVAAQLRPELILLDVHRDQGRGLGVALQLKGDPDTAVIPILYLAAPCAPEPAEAAGMESGSDSYLVVPVEPQVLRTMVRVLLRIRESERQRVALVESEKTARAEADAARASASEKGEMLQLLIEQSGDAIVAVDASGVVRTFNHEAERVFGVARQEKGWADWAGAFTLFDLQGQPLPSNERAIYRALQGENVQDARCEVRLRNGTRRIIVATGRPLRRRDRTLAGAIVIARDETQRVDRERGEHFLLECSRALADLEASQIIEAVTQLSVPTLADICLFDLKVNDEFRRVALTHVDPSLQSLLEEACRFPPPMTNEHHPVVRAIRTGEPQLCLVDEKWLAELGTSQEHVELFRKLDVASTLSVPVTSGGTVIGALTFGLTQQRNRRFSDADVSIAQQLADRTAAALHNAQLYQLAQEAIQARDEVLSFVSHDLRSPLAAIHATVSLGRLEAERDGSEPHKSVDIIERCVERMDRLIAEMLDLGLIRAHRFSIRPQVWSLPVLLDELIASCAAQATQGRVDLRCEVAADLPPVRCDRDRVLQVLSNLVTNSVNVTPEGGTIVLRAELRGEEEVLLAVLDTGPGIAPADLPHLFERYWRANHLAYRGTGLGLAISKGIIEAHGGRIWAENRPAGGSGLFFTLPIAGVSRSGPSGST